MTLQDITKKKINKYGGINKFIEDCELLKLRGVNITSYEKSLIDGTITYFRFLFSIKIDLEHDLLNNQDLVFRTKEVFRTQLLHGKSDVCKFYIDLSQHNVEYVKGIRKIAV